MSSSSTHLFYLQILLKYILNSLFSFNQIWEWSESLKYINFYTFDENKQLCRGVRL